MNPFPRFWSVKPQPLGIAVREHLCQGILTQFVKPHLTSSTETSYNVSHRLRKREIHSLRTCEVTLNVATSIPPLITDYPLVQLVPLSKLGQVNVPVKYTVSELFTGFPCHTTVY